MKRLTIDEKIKNIDDERLSLLNNVKSSLINRKNDLDFNMEKTLTYLTFYDKNAKEYKAILRAKNTINSLLEEIVNAKNEEDIIKIRKRLNYYINLLKNELKDRHISESRLNRLYDSITVTRKDIAFYLRILKRRKNIEEIDQLYKSNQLSFEQKDRLKKLITNERRYNKINNNKVNIYLVDNKPYNNSKEVKERYEYEELKQLFLKNKKVNNIENIEDTYEDNNDVLETQKKEVNNLAIKNNSLAIANSNFKLEKNKLLKSPQKNIIKALFNKFDINYNNLLEELRLKVQIFKNNYNHITPHRYQGNILNKIVTFIKNISLYKYNNKQISIIEQEHNYNFEDEDLKAYLEYIKKQNSLEYALSNIFNNSNLSKREKECLDNHYRCAEWISRYYINDSNSLTYIKIA